MLELLKSLKLLKLLRLLKLLKLFNLKLKNIKYEMKIKKKLYLVYKKIYKKI